MQLVVVTETEWHFGVYGIISSFVCFISNSELFNDNAIVQ